MPPLGFAVVALVLGPLLALLGWRRWLRAEARRAEVMRLGLLAAEEAALAEEEALRLGGYGEPAVSRASQERQVALRSGYVGPLTLPSPPPGPKMTSVCAVCHSPTKKWCSRCKAVRYCSGKCQIIHWRQGHKNECCPPRVDDHYSDKVGTAKSKGINAEGFELCKNSLDNSGNSQKEAAMSFPKKLSSESSSSSEAFSDDEFINSSGTESTSDSSDSASSCLSTSYGPVGVYDDSSTPYPSLPQKAGAGKHLSSDASHDKLRGVIEQRGSSFPTEDVKCSPLGPKLSDSGCSNFKPSKGGGECENVVVDCPGMSQSGNIVGPTESKICKESQGNQSDVRSHLQASSKIYNEAICSQPKSRSEVSSRSSLSGAVHTNSIGSIIPTNESGSLATSKSARVQLVKSKSLMSSPGIVDQASPIGTFVSDDVSRKVENAPKAPMKLYQNAGSHSTDIKTSVQRVVQQLKLSKISRQHRSSFGNDLTKRTKMLFPYEYFVELYSFDKVEIRPSGLINCHNSCYANSVLQCLVFTPPLTAYLLQGLHSRKCLKEDWCFTCELENLLTKAKLGQSPLSPDGILSRIHKIGSNLGHGREEDAHEFLRYAIDAMQYVCLKEAGTHALDRWAEETTLMQLTFGGYLRSKIECMKCHSRSERYERMMDLTVEIEGNIGTLEDALKKFTSTETLDGENKYQCPRCKSYERARKKLTIVDAPNILTIALKRFQSGKFGKINKAVRFPENLDLAPYMRGSTDKSQLYKLYAVVVHLDVMNASFSGHYVCYVKNRQGKWYKADDTMVKSVELDQVLSNNAYMLLYARCSPHPPSLTSSILPPDQVASKRSRSNDAFSSGYDRQQKNYTAVTTITDPPVPRDRRQDGECNRTTERFNYEPYYLYNGIFHFPKTDSSSDTSSLFSCSDEASCSTESTRNSTSTDDYSEYIFGEIDHHSWNSPLRFSSDSDGTANSPLYSTHASVAASCMVDSVVVDRGWNNSRVQYLQDGGGAPFLYSDTTNQCSKLTERSRSRESVGVDLSKVKSRLLLRSSTTRDNRTTGSFY